MLKILKNLAGTADAPPTVSPVAYPRPMAELVEYLVLLQARGTAPGCGRKGSLLRLGATLSEDPYCRGYLHGMFDALCQQWDVPAPEQRVVIGTASTLMFRNLLEGRCHPHDIAKIEDAAFNALHAHANDAAFLRGKFDGCSELNRYAATKQAAHMPARLHERLKCVAAGT